ncbi:MAG: SUMF1/EgtB/PvdO family nonheme iron enzyme [Planctomycetes bacterium]|nr:SUMF1/EgtB/PvdO family nonheme iron enzyme [Planctomycetota bacterium]
MSDDASRWPVARGYLRAALMGLVEEIPFVGKALIRVVEHHHQHPDPGADELDDAFRAIVSAASHGDPGRTQAVAALPEAVVTQAVKEASSRLRREERERLEKAAADLEALPPGAPLDDFFHTAANVLAGSPAVRHCLLSYAHQRLGRPVPHAPGEVIDGRFVVVEFLGEGGMGIVYRVHDRRRDVDVALKLLSRSLVADPAAKARFRKEVNLALQLSHPNIVRVHDLGEADGQLYMHMELVEGQTLRAPLTAGAMPLPRAAAIARGLLAGLAHAHQKGVLHLDVKPENILLRRGGDVALADFGLARGMGVDAFRSMLTGAGTPGYMAPEQFKGERDLDARADVFAAGAVLYEMLTGERAIGAFEPLPEELPDGLRVAVHRSLSQRKEKRPVDATALLALLEEAVHPPTIGSSEGLVATVVAGAPRADAAKVFTLPEPVARPASLPPPLPATVLPPPLPQAPRPAVPPPLHGLSPLGKNGQGYDEYRHAGTGLILLHVPAGEFRMGSERAADERPVHGVRLAAYLLGKGPVTNAQYRAFCRATGTALPTDLPSRWLYADYCTSAAYDAHPVVNVSWQDARAFAAWAGLRLPSEAEWERAAGWDAVAGRARSFPWGEEPASPKLANFGRPEGGGSYTTAVGAYPAGASPCGALDMAGNVWEWCADWYDDRYYETCPERVLNPRGPEAGSERVVRGGSWVDDGRGLRAGFRFAVEPDFRWAYIGFRVAGDFPTGGPAHAGG